MDNSCIETSLDLVDGSEHFDNEYMLHVVTELDGTKRQLNCEQHRVSELEEQLSALSKWSSLSLNFNYKLIEFISMLQYKKTRLSKIVLLRQQRKVKK